MASENDRENDRDEDERDEDEGDLPDIGPVKDENAAPDPNIARNRAERRTAAKAARRGRVAKLADDNLAVPTEVVEDPDGLMAPATSIGGGTRRLDEGDKRPKVPPRTMSKGTGNAEGVPEWALKAGDWFAQNRSQAVTVVLGTALLLGVFFGWRAYSVSHEARATNAYYDGLTAMFAAITPEEPPADDPRRALPHYRTFEARAQAALEKLRSAERANPSARATALIRLSEASTLYQLGRYAEAKNLYQGILGGDLAGLEGRAIEGLAFTLESLGDLDGAMARYRELQSVQGGIFRDQSQFYQARLLVRRNDAARAKDLLHTVIERVGRPAASDPTASAQTALKEQCLAILRDLDPTDPAVVAADRARESSGGGDAHGGHGGPGGADPMQGLPPELREQLQKMLRERGAGGGAPRGGGN
jgi:tetratricopeptide (TPR) repeat protein